MKCSIPTPPAEFGRRFNHRILSAQCGVSFGGHLFTVSLFARNGVDFEYEPVPFEPHNYLFYSLWPASGSTDKSVMAERLLTNGLSSRRRINKGRSEQEKRFSSEYWGLGQMLDRTCRLGGHSSAVVFLQKISS